MDRIKAVDKHRQKILDALDYIWKNPETGFREVKTSAYLEKEFEGLGYTLTRAGNIPGFYTDIDTGRPGPTVLVFGEMDSLICWEHPDADPQTGAVHCCGHVAQVAALLGIAAALKEPGALEGLCGRIRLCAVPAEELIEVEYRSQLKEKGIIRYMGGKSEFLYRGYLDGVDIVFMVHAGVVENCTVRKGSVGCLAKRVIYKGKSSHAGGSPWNGCNALYAASQGLNAINAIRETFQEQDLVRVHPIITKGGNAVNAIPDEVIIESYVRGATFDAMKKTNEKVNRALCGAALSLGANVEIQDTPGYAPLNNDDGMIQLVQDAAQALGYPIVYNEVRGTGSTDMGEISCLFPAVHPYMPGSVGTSHGKDYYIADPDKACLGSAKWQLKMLELLLENDAVCAKQIIADFKPEFASKEEYFAYIDAMECSGDRITYTGGKAEVKL